MCGSSDRLSQCFVTFHFNNILYPTPFSRICMNVRSAQVISSDRHFSSLCYHVIMLGAF